MRGSKMTTEQSGPSVDDLLSIRNLVETDMGPLRRFKGVFESMPYTVETYGEGTNARQSTRVTLNFKGLEVVEAVEPYQFPIYSLPPISASNRKRSKWGIMGISCASILDQQYSAEQLDPSNPVYIPPAKRMNLKDLIGKRMGMVLADGENGRPTPPELWDGRAAGGEGANVPTPCWKVYEVEGIGVAGGQGKTALDRAIELLEGKTMADFNAVAMSDPLIRTDAALLTSISAQPDAPTNFCNTMLTTGNFIKDAQEVFHKVVPAANAPTPAAPVVPITPATPVV